MGLLKVSAILSVLCAVYFAFMANFEHNQIDFTGLRFGIELLTIPMLLTIPFALFCAIRYFKLSPKLAGISILFSAITIAILFSIGN